MAVHPDKNVYRLIDANFNRAKEGLRVCEDISRFVFDNRSLTGKYKAVRHALTDAALPLGWLRGVQSREAAGDVGRPSTDYELKRRCLEDILYANSQRVKESLRVLEEFAKLFSRKQAESFKGLRYRVYVLEQDAMACLRLRTPVAGKFRAAGARRSL